jgi:hypothetical protein|eukprot:CAMPEP_0174333094 /NCGR_PEP_ID=MMETSP0810-20121108/18854_1 /TAXON_ID=73025 ORGANISM="Eutreptiella gymnastica-like, Strain CCMP1594" /NCGR_SAMPLE_ID=MMETSP0810 /ASSEMBLY_ACC=CAM_ASM_000659 /LENGTH=62 /DNA_ID=CAMNT_0015449959 /DNA_START=647 /DNA_END=835 /DNA_ORIENTATION=+
MNHRRVTRRSRGLIKFATTVALLRRVDVGMLLGCELAVREGGSRAGRREVRAGAKFNEMRFF